ncbi:hypothetical protein, partial [Zoogloea sp.]|uniref:hypothetical protein n=1 Tax=Zoogloea sp. TaxID=49181 RepID=UPI0035AF78EE
TTATPSATDPVKPAGKPAVGLADALAPAPGTTARAPGGLDVPAEAPRFVGDVSGGGAVRRFATDASLVKINRAQITLTLGAGSEGPLMEFMLGSDDKRTAASAASARQASVEKAKLPPLDDDAYADVRVVLNAAELSGIALSVGAVWWATRAGGLVASLLMAAPAWRTFDPLPVLGPQDEEEGGDWGETMDDEMEKDEMAAADVFDDRDVTRGGA